MVGGATPSTWNFGSSRSQWSEIADFQPIIVSAVTPSEKSSISTNRKSSTRSPMSPRWTLYVVPKPPKGAQECKVLSCITPKRYEIGCQLLLITNRKSHTGFRLLLTSMTLNGAIALILDFLPNAIALQADYVTVVEDRPIMSVKYCLPVLVFHFWLKLTHPAAQSLCDSWASFIIL